MSHRRLVILSLFWLFVPLISAADNLRPAYLQIKAVSDQEFDVLFSVPVLGQGRALALPLTFSEDAIQLTPPAVSLDAGAARKSWRMRRPEGIQQLTIGFARPATAGEEVLVRIEYLNGASATARLSAAMPVYTLPATIGLVEASITYLVLGVEHILFGLDHLLFVLLLLFLAQGVRTLVITITAFTLAHSVTLIFASLGWIAFPVPPVEAIIALSIVFLAREVIRQSSGTTTLTTERSWLVAFGFGLLHGLGFSAALSEVGLPQEHLVVSLLLFNLGVELGQLIFIAAFLLTGYVLKSFYLNSNKFDRWQRVPTYCIGIVASFWVIERVGSFF